MVKIAVIIQARMGSTRLPGKVLMDICGRPMLWHILERLKKSENIDLIILATSNKEEDSEIVALAKKSGVEVFTGSEKDVLDRYYHAAKEYSIDIIIRVCGDCPLIDPGVIDEMVSYYMEHEDELDYIGMGEDNPYPYGLDAEVFSFDTLEKAWLEAELPSEREHVTPYIWKNKDKFRIGACLKSDKDYSHLRWVVDEKIDFDFITEIFRKLYKENEFFTTQDVLDLLEAEPELIKINEDVVRAEGYYKSLEEDEEFKKKKKNNNLY